MPVLGFSVTRPSDSAVLALVQRLDGASLTYPGVGATTASPAAWPSGYHHDRYGVPLGQGDAVWRRARDALRGWEAHRPVGGVTPPDAPLLVGTTVAVTVRLGLVWTVAPCRIVAVVDEDDRFGFSYGTLPGHPVRGEEAFHVSRAEDGSVAFEIVAFSRPATWLARLGAPVSRRVQARMTERYLEGVRDYVGR